MSAANFTLPFPDRNACYGNFSIPECQEPTLPMLLFLNISTASDYIQAYCLNPPSDSCAFGFCPNPDVASPAVRYSTYFTAVMSAALVLYSPEDVTSTFFSQLLNVYSLIIAAIASIAEKNLTKPHTGVALALSASPLSIYLIFYVIRSMLGNPNRLQTVFGRGQWLNRVAVLLLFPVWLTVLVFSALPHGSAHFQQAACDGVVANHHVLLYFFIPFILFFAEKQLYVFTAVSASFFTIPWVGAIYLQRRKIWKKGRIFPAKRMWRKVVDAYPFIQFYTVILFPHAIWIWNVEFAIAAMLQREYFSFTYGQMLAVLVTIPPLFQFFLLTPRIYWWFLDLTWIRFVTGRRNTPRHYHHRTGTTASNFDADSIPLVPSSSKSKLYEASSIDSKSADGIPFYRQNSSIG